MNTHILVRKTKRGNRTFSSPNFSKASRTIFEVGDKVILPIERSRRGFACMWESGCRYLSSMKSTHSRPYGVVIADRNDMMLDAIGYNRIHRGLKFIQALVPLPVNSSVYFGSLHIKRTSLSLSIKVAKLSYKGEYPDPDDTEADLGEFEVTAVFNNYDDVETSIPAKRLVKKLYTPDVGRPFFANTWGYYKANSNGVEEIVNGLYNRVPSKDETYHDFESFVDDVEVQMAKQAGGGKGKPLILQIFDFNNDKMIIHPLINITDISKVEFKNVRLAPSRSIKFDDIDSRLNHYLTIGRDLSNLRFIFDVDNNSFNAVQVKPNIWALIRTFKA